jgi:hypothetical protein
MSTTREMRKRTTGQDRDLEHQTSEFLEYFKVTKTKLYDFSKVLNEP